MSASFLTNVLRGIQRIAATGEMALRGGGYSQLLVNDIGLGRYFEMVNQGQVFTSMIKAVTVAATHNSPIAAATATPVIGLANPLTSGKAGVLLHSSFSTVSGTPAGGQGVLNVQAGGANNISAAAAGSITNRLTQAGPSPQGSIMKPLNNTALTGWAANPNAVAEVDLIGSATAAAAAGNTGPGDSGQDIAGLTIWTPGDLLALMAGSGAGTAWIVNGSLTWVEIPWPFN
jgi:hypothetical protein